MNTTDLRTGEDWLRAVPDVAMPVESLEVALHAWQAKGTVLVPYAVTEMVPATKPDRAHWTAQYFFRQVTHAKHNFSAERAEHLLRVRAYLEQLGAAGFVKLADSTPLAKDKVDATAVAAAFSPTSSLARALGTGDAEIIRSALVLELADARLSGAYLQAAMALAADQKETVFVPFEEGRFMAPLNGDRAAWSSQYHDDQMVYLDANFSIERFLHVVDVREHLRLKGAAGFAPLAPAPVAATLSAKAGSTGDASAPRHGVAPEGDTSKGNRAAWAGRIAMLLAAGIAALAAYFRGGRR